MIDGRGKYVIPGLWDMHAHIDYAGILARASARSIPVVGHLPVTMDGTEVSKAGQRSTNIGATPGEGYSSIVPQKKGH